MNLHIFLRKLSVTSPVLVPLLPKVEPHLKNPKNNLEKATFMEVPMMCFQDASCASIMSSFFPFSPPGGPCDFLNLSLPHAFLGLHLSSYTLCSIKV